MLEQVSAARDLDCAWELLRTATAPACLLLLLLLLLPPRPFVYIPALCHSLGLMQLPSKAFCPCLLPCYHHMTSRKRGDDCLLPAPFSLPGDRDGQAACGFWPRRRSMHPGTLNLVAMPRTVPRDLCHRLHNSRVSLCPSLRDHT